MYFFASIIVQPHSIVTKSKPLSIVTILKPFLIVTILKPLSIITLTKPLSTVGNEEENALKKEDWRKMEGIMK